ncbi:MAG: C25 family cysteine peptidase [Bacteroidales bacterium]
MIRSPGKSALITCIAILSGVNIHAQSQLEKVIKTGISEQTSFRSESNKITITYCLPEFSVSAVNEAGMDFFSIVIPGHTFSTDPGKPQFPVLSRLIRIPEDENYTIRISEIKTTRITASRQQIRGQYYPRQPDQVKNNDRQKQGFAYDRDYYSKRGFAGPDTARIEKIGSLSGIKLATLEISPVRYDPVRNVVEIITRMKIEISFKSSLTKSVTSGSLQFDQLASKGVLNYDPDDVIPGYFDKPVKMVILADTIFRKSLAPFVKWKTQKGFKIIELYKGTGLAGTTYSEMKNKLAAVYQEGVLDNYAPVYLLIVGDITRIPTSEGTTQVSDLYWGEFNGEGDYIPEMFIGRLPASDTAELNNMIRKITSYEKFQFGDTTKFYKRALISAGEEPAFAEYMNGQLNYEKKYYLNSTKGITSHAFYYPNAATSEDSIKKVINLGVSLVNYTGHGDTYGWLDPLIKVAEVNALTNKHKYPFVVVNACKTGNFSVTGSFGNTWIKSKDKGAVGFIGCTNDSYWSEDFYWSVGTGTPSLDPKYEETGLGAMDRLFHTHNESPSDWYITMGQVNYAGNLAVSSSTSGRKKYYWETYSLLGDPSLVPFIGNPGTFTISIPDTLPNGYKSLNMVLPPFSYAALTHADTLWDAGYSSPSGSVTLEMPGLSNDSCLLVITGQNKIPVIKTIHFAPLDKEYVSISSIDVNDSPGNGNSLADYNETVYLRLRISNNGLKPATGIYVKVTSASSDITLLNDSVYVGNLAGGAEVVLSDKLGVRINSMITDKSSVTFDIILADDKTSAANKYDLMLHSPVLELINCIIDDSGTGNGDLVADPGETASLVIKIRNTGTGGTTGNIKLSSTVPGIVINQPTLPTGPIAAGSTISIPVSVTFSPALTKGSSVDFQSILDCTPYIINKVFTVPVGKIRESFEYQSFTIFPWINKSSYPWIVTGNVSYEGQYSARSPVITSVHNIESILRMYVNCPVPDTVRFNVKVSSEKDFDYLHFRLNGKVRFSMTGETEWTSKKIPIPEGISLLEWIYKKDQSVTAGSDCAWLDYISFPVLSLGRVDLKSTRILSPEPNQAYGMETISVQVVNFGADTIKSFNMAYTVNQSVPVLQQFTRKINPGDTSSVSFSTPADLRKSGTYIIQAYGLNNNDVYLANDTAKAVLAYTLVTPTDSPDSSLNIYPNPFESSFRIAYSLPVSEEVSLYLCDLTGRVLYEIKMTALAGENTFEVTPTRLHKGFYTLILKGKSIFRTAAIVKKD